MNKEYGKYIKDVTANFADYDNLMKEVRELPAMLKAMGALETS